MSAKNFSWAGLVFIFNQRIEIVMVTNVASINATLKGKTIESVSYTQDSKNYRDMLLRFTDGSEVRLNFPVSADVEPYFKYTAACNIFKTSYDWFEVYPFLKECVRDYDGWNRHALEESMKELIPIEELRFRILQSTVLSTPELMEFLKG